MIQDQGIHEELIRLWKRSGRPSCRTLGAWAGLSHQTVAVYLRGEMRDLGTLLRVVEALKGDGGWFTEAWDRARPGLEGSLPRRPVDVLEEILVELREIKARL